MSFCVARVLRVFSVIAERILTSLCIISCLCISAVGICPCRYHSMANRKMKRLRRCRYAMSGFLQLRSGVLWREDCAVIHRLAPMIQKARWPIHEELTHHCRTCREDSEADCKRYSWTRCHETASWLPNWGTYGWESSRWQAPLLITAGISRDMLCGEVYGGWRGRGSLQSKAPRRLRTLRVLISSSPDAKRATSRWLAALWRRGRDSNSW